MIDKLDLTQQHPLVFVDGEIAVMMVGDVSKAVTDILRDMGLNVLIENYTYGTTKEVDEYLDTTVYANGNTTFTFVGCYELNSGDSLDEVDFADVDSKLSILAMVQDELNPEAVGDSYLCGKNLTTQARALLEIVVAHESWHVLDPATDAFSAVRSNLAETSLYLNIVGGEITINKEDVRILGGILGHVNVKEDEEFGEAIEALLCINIGPAEFEHINKIIDGYTMYTIRDFNGTLWITNGVSKGPTFQGLTVFVKDELPIQNITPNGIGYTEILIGGLQENLTPTGIKEEAYKTIADFINIYVEKDLDAKLLELNAEANTDE